MNSLLHHHCDILQIDFIVKLIPHVHLSLYGLSPRQ
jgi:hypothetical protein